MLDRRGPAAGRDAAGDRGDLDILLAHTPRGHRRHRRSLPAHGAPLSIGELDGCVVACPLHEGRFDLAAATRSRCRRPAGSTRTAATTRPGRRAGRDPKVDPPGKKAEARRLTRVRRFRYYPVRIVDGRIEVALPR